MLNSFLENESLSGTTLLEQPTNFMTSSPPTRRQFLGAFAAASGAAVLPGVTTTPTAEAAPALHLAANQYAWFTFYRRRKKDWSAELETGLAELPAAGLDGYEPLVNHADEVRRLAPLLSKHGLAMRSLYVNSTLHRREEAAKSIEAVLAIAEAARPLGTTIIVTNPSPIRWGGTESKTDDELRTQAESLATLGIALKTGGQTLAYHTHDVEMLHAAREFHHMMLATDPRHVALCLDAHWIYRGSGNSQVALFDVLRLYGPRVVEVHLRQSRQGVWSEAFGVGDIDYARLVAELTRLKRRPHYVLEQCLEAASPDTMEALAAHRQGAAYARNLLDG